MSEIFEEGEGEKKQEERKLKGRGNDKRGCARKREGNLMEMLTNQEREK